MINKKIAKIHLWWKQMHKAMLRMVWKFANCFLALVLGVIYEIAHFLTKGYLTKNHAFKISHIAHVMPNHRTGSLLIQEIACYLINTKPLPEPMLTAHSWTHRGKFQWDLNQNRLILIQENAFMPQCVKKRPKKLPSHGNVFHNRRYLLPEQCVIQPNSMRSIYLCIWCSIAWLA